MFIINYSRKLLASSFEAKNLFEASHLLEKSALEEELSASKIKSLNKKPHQKNLGNGIASHIDNTFFLDMIKVTVLGGNDENAKDVFINSMLISAVSSIISYHLELFRRDMLN